MNDNSESTDVEPEPHKDIFYEPYIPSPEAIDSGKTETGKFKLFGKEFSKDELIPIIILALALLINLFSLYNQFTNNINYPSDISTQTHQLWITSIFLAVIAAWFFTIPFQTISNSISITLQKSIRQLFSDCLQYFTKIFSTCDVLDLPNILFFAFLIRFIPVTKNGIFPDEWFWLENARGILNHTVVSPFGIIGDQPSNMPAYFVALLLDITQNAVLAVRLPGVIYSIITIAIAFSLLSKLLGRKAAVAGSILMSVSAWDIHNSNLGWNNVSPNPLLVILVVYLLFLVWTNRYTYITLFLLALVLSICAHLLYVAALMLIPAGIFLCLHWFKNINIKKIKEILIFCLLLIICVSPLVSKIFRDPSGTIRRHGEFLNLNATLAANSNSPLVYYGDQILSLIDDFSIGADSFKENLLWGITLEPVIVFLFCLGMIILLVQLVRKRIDQFWWVIIGTLVVVLIIPEVILYRSSSVWRSYGSWPLIYLIAIYAFSQIVNLFTFSQFWKGIPRFVLSLCLLAYFLISFSWFRTFGPFYIEPVIDYSTGICKSVLDTIDKRIPEGSTIFIPYEMCYHHIVVMYDNNEYNFIPITEDFDKSQVVPDTYLVVFNSFRYIGGPYDENLQNLAVQILQEHNYDVITTVTTAFPDIYAIR